MDVVIANYLFNKNVRSGFTTKVEDDKKKNNKGIEAMFSILFLVLFYGALFFVWARFVYVAFGCSMKEGFASMFFTFIYAFWKLGSLIQTSCAQSSTGFF